MNDECKRLRELLERIVAGDVGRMIYAKLATGQATETDDGKAWLELLPLLATPPADDADMGGQAGQEPVAWLSLDGRSAYTEDDLDTITANYRATLRPLYTTPQPAPAQDVAEDWSVFIGYLIRQRDEALAKLAEPEALEELRALLNGGGGAYDCLNKLSKE